MPREKPMRNSLPSGVITAMFTDIVDSTRIKSMMEGETSARRDSQFRQSIKEPHDAIVLGWVRQAGGYIVNPTGDGFCITFVDAEEAVLCALRIQRQLEEQPISTPVGALKIRIGLHTGIAGASGDDYIASTIDKTARVQSQAAGGQVFVSHQTQVLVSDKTQGVQFEARGIYDLKGLQSEELYQVMPLAHLELSPANLSAPASSSVSAPAWSKSQSKPVNGDKTFVPHGQPPKQGARVLALVGLLLIGSIGVAVWSGARKKSPSITSVSAPAVELFPAKSQWSGSFHFLPPMARYDGSVDIRVTQRSGEDFTGIYSSEGGKYQWMISGTVRASQLRWKFIKALKNPGKDDAVGKAFGEATLQAKQMKGFFRMYNNAAEVAELELRRTQ